MGAILAELTKIVDAGSLKPLVDKKCFTLDDVGQVYGHVTSGKATGKVVVER